MGVRASRGGFWIFDDQKLIGINLGVDFCAEHEWGIDGLNCAFGIDLKDESKVGVALRTATQVPPLVEIVDLKSASYLVVSSGRFSPAVSYLISEVLVGKDHANEGQKEKRNGSHFTSGWSENSFVIGSGLKEGKGYLKEIKEAILNKNVCVFLADRKNPFGRSGLTICIADRIPAEGRSIMEESDLNQRAIEKAVQTSGIREYLAEKGKKYFALSPRWANDEKSELTFFLNPCDQESNDFGWFSVQELREWGENRGPIPKTC
jgi:hypothetical protein